MKKTCFELEYEETIIDNLLELVKFMDTIVSIINFNNQFANLFSIQNSWIDMNAKDLDSFQVNYHKLSELYSKSKNYFKITNIHRPFNLDFEGYFFKLKYLNI